MCRLQCATSNLWACITLLVIALLSAAAEAGGNRNPAEAYLLRNHLSQWPVSELSEFMTKRGIFCNSCLSKGEMIERIERYVFKDGCEGCTFEESFKHLFPSLEQRSLRNVVKPGRLPSVPGSDSWRKMNEFIMQHAAKMSGEAMDSETEAKAPPRRERPRTGPDSILRKEVPTREETAGRASSAAGTNADAGDRPLSSQGSDGIVGDRSSATDIADGRGGSSVPTSDSEQMSNARANVAVDDIDVDINETDGGELDKQFSSCGGSSGSAESGSTTGSLQQAGNTRTQSTDEWNTCEPATA